MSQSLTIDVIDIYIDISNLSSLLDLRPEESAARLQQLRQQWHHHLAPGEWTGRQAGDQHRVGGLEEVVPKKEQRGWWKLWKLLVLLFLLCILSFVCLWVFQWCCYYYCYSYWYWDYEDDEDYDEEGDGDGDGDGDDDDDDDEIFPLKNVISCVFKKKFFPKV